MQLLKLVYLLLTITVVNTVPIPKEDPEVTHKVTFEITQGDSSLGNLTLGLFGTTTPLTAENFYELSKTKYKGSIFHRVIKDFMIQGGDFENGDGTGGYSIYGKKAGSLPDENFDLKHDRLGRLSMANSGKNTGGSQFFITNSITEWLDGQHVVFGQLLEGFETLNMIENSKTKKNNNRPLDDIIISEVHYSKTLDFGETKEQADSETEASTTIKEPPGEIAVPSKETDGVTETDDSGYKPGAPDADLFAAHETEAELEAERIHEEKEDSFNAPRKHIIVIPFLFVILLCVYAGVKFRKVIVFNIRGPRYRKI